MWLAIVCQKSRVRRANARLPHPPSQQVPQIPDLNSLRNDSSVQLLVEQQVKQLAEAEKTGTKIKSLRGGGGGGGGGRWRSRF